MSMILGSFAFHLCVSPRSLQPVALVCLCWLDCFWLVPVGELNFDLFFDF